MNNYTLSGSERVCVLETEGLSGWKVAFVFALALDLTRMQKKVQDLGMGGCNPTHGIATTVHW